MSSSLQQPNRSRRCREPLSCYGCRVKKLKCDRQRPCSNCSTRRLSCSYNREPSAALKPIPAQNDYEALQAQNSALKTRVLRLEKAVFGQCSTAGPQEARVAASTPASEDAEGTFSNITRSQWLEGLGAYTTHDHPSERFQARLRTPDQLAFDAQQQTPPPDLCIPTRDMAIACLDLFEAHLDAIQAVLHLPSVRKMVNKVYASQDVETPSTPGPVALILAICAAMGSWELDWHSLFTDQCAAARVSTFLSKEAMRALETARTSSQISIEAVQATIILTFHFCHLEGLSPHTRLLHSSAVIMARELGLHKIDAPGRSPPSPTQAQIIDAEVARKVWWHIACTDWLFSFSGGQHEGVYSVHLQHMAVNTPRNLTHQDLTAQDEAFHRPEDKPTIMAFHLQRIKVATICREVMDEMWSSSVVLKPEQIDYKKIAELDTRFHELIDDLPSFLRLDSATEALDLGQDDTLKRQMAVQRATINLMIYARRCKLHLPCLTYFRSNDHYELSRNICLDSARKVFQVRSRFNSQGLETFFNLGGQLSHIFYAAFVLVMDLCMNRESDDREHIAEVQHAINVMQQARTSSRIASACYESLMEILRKHGVDLPLQALVNGQVNGEDHGLTGSNYQSESELAVPHAQPTSTASRSDPDQEMANAGEDFEAFWQDYLNSSSSQDAQTWEALLSDLEMHIV